MKSSPKVGSVGEVQFTVEKQHAIDFADQQMPAVLSTPWLVWFLEHAVREAVLQYLEPGESTVGTHIDVRHLAPTPLGERVTCLLGVIHTEGPVVSMQFEVRDDHELIVRRNSQVADHSLRALCQESPQGRPDNESPSTF